MTIPSRQIMIRLPNDLAKKFDDVCDEFRGLPPATIMRMLVADQLEKEQKTVLLAVNKQVRKGSGASGARAGVKSSK